MTDERRKQRDAIPPIAQMIATREFLRRLAKHLETNDMPGQAGNCMIHAAALQRAIDMMA